MLQTRVFKINYFDTHNEQGSTDLVRSWELASVWTSKKMKRRTGPVLKKKTGPVGQWIPESGILIIRETKFRSWKVVPYLKALKHKYDPIPMLRFDWKSQIAKSQYLREKYWWSYNMALIGHFGRVDMKFSNLATKLKNISGNFLHF